MYVLCGVLKAQLQGAELYVAPGCAPYRGGRRNSCTGSRANTGMPTVSSGGRPLGAPVSQRETGRRLLRPAESWSVYAGLACMYSRTLLGRVAERRTPATRTYSWGALGWAGKCLSAQANAGPCPVLHAAMYSTLQSLAIRSPKKIRITKYCSAKPPPPHLAFPGDLPPPTVDDLSALPLSAPPSQNCHPPCHLLQQKFHLPHNGDAPFLPPERLQREYLLPY